MDFSINNSISKEFILNNVNQETILSYYLHEPIDGKKLICSPFREDKNPTCGVYKSKSGKIYIHDFATNEYYDCFTSVMKLYNCTYHKALKIIAKDFNLIQSEEQYKPTNRIPVQNKLDTSKKSIIKVEIQDFSKEELKWWENYGITPKILKKFHIFSCKHIFLNGKLFSSSSKNCPIYGYYGGHDKNIELWRIYFPKKKNYRFISNWNSKKIQGFKQLPKSGKLLVITKSLKDVACYSSLGIPAIAPNSEHLFLNPSLLNDLKLRFKYIIVHYDNDRTGKYNLAKIRIQFPELYYFFIPNKYGTKDISDFHKKYKRDKTIAFLKQNILNLSNYVKNK